MTKKYITFTYENGAEWRIPLEIVADNRATYYTNRDKDTTYEEEYRFVMTDHYEGIDWFFNQMNWDEVPAFQYVAPREFHPATTDLPVKNIRIESGE